MEGIEPLHRVSEMIYVDLREGYDAAWDKYSSKRRQEVRRAARNGATMRIVPADELHINRFVDLYDSTMSRKKTKSVYFYSSEFFVELFGELKERALLVEAYAGDQLASSTIFLLGNKCVWAQYEGTNSSVRETDANLYKTDRMISWSADSKYDYFLLGGGFSENDGGYQYKMRYSKLTAPVLHLRKIHNPSLLQELVSEKAAYDRTLGRTTREDYFPSYWLT
jgi:CelD/BcsL family acetyltransferase involved in cellulose biosynthesis